MKDYIKISELEPTTDLEGLYTIGSDKNNLSKKVALQFLKDAANYANEQGDYAKQVGDTVNGNVGVSDYPEFSASTSYVIGDMVRYNGALYIFTANHAASAWNGNDVKATSINAITSGKLTELESEVQTSREQELIYTDIVSTRVSQNSAIIGWNIKANDKFLFKVKNATKGKNVAIGTILAGMASGFEELFLSSDSKESYEVIIEVTKNADSFKLYSAGTETIIEVHQIISSVKQSVKDMDAVVASTALTLDANNTTIIPFPTKKGDRLLFRVSGAVNAKIMLGAIANSGDAGFAQLLYSGENSPMSNFDVFSEINAEYGFIKAYTQSTGVSVKIYKYQSRIELSENGLIGIKGKVDSIDAELNGDKILSFDIPVTQGVDFSSDNIIDVNVSASDEYIVRLAYNGLIGGTNIYFRNREFGEVFAVDENNNRFSNISTGSLNSLGYIRFEQDVDYVFFYGGTPSGTGYITLTFEGKNRLIGIKGKVDGIKIGGYNSRQYTNLGNDNEGGKNDYCTSVGYGVLKNNTGKKNVTIGSDNMRETSGSDNTSAGYHAMFRNTKGSNNSAVGSEASDDNTEGNNNTSMGFCALQRNNIGSDNVAVGAFALQGIYDNSFDANNLKSHNRNTIIGARAMKDAEVGSDDNVAIGYNALSSKKQYKGCVALGTNADCTKNNQMMLGSSIIEEVVLMGNKKLIFGTDGIVRWETI